MIRRILALFDPFIGALLATVVLASVLPARGGFVPVVDIAADAGIVLLFFLHGAKLSREAIIQGLANWRLHLTVLAATFVMFPLLGLGFAAVPGLPVALASGLLFLTLLPSTVQSSIAFTSIARGNVAAAVCTASFSNLLGIFLTPVLAVLLMGGSQVELSFDSVTKIVLQLLLPFLVGHALRPLIGAFVTKHKWILSKVDRGSILLVVYAAFGAAVVEGLWSEVSWTDLAIVLACCSVLLAVVLALTWWAGKLVGFSYEDQVVLLFAGSKKSLASGVPIAGVLFAPAEVGAILLPLMLFHQLQLIACAIIAKRLSARPDVGGNPAAA
ncbi:sodium/bile acid cotransporter 7 [Altererythrobacter atlanticus]|uniref:Sodium Bile acid symporter family protein n=1 Tax=Croceibacterium atlanticum TaxID=1267766 RepID=A0A0F7KWU9_9SPHN|nr:bile acid:sodium symporter family protein [Croceibacterium atlanticum]AKH44144.1 Sodium Bile acid symporter family protein [Croceibacterium atlanticum]MBB5732454.1 sodium/bile acid cotransporter 7 [Croceibacterium atlanticum]